MASLAKSDMWVNRTEWLRDCQEGRRSIGVPFAAMMALRRHALEGAAMVVNTRWPACRAGLCACSVARAQVGRRELV